MTEQTTSIANYLQPLPRLKLSDKLFKVSFKRGPEAHLKIISQDVCHKCIDKPCLYVCPFNVFNLEEKDTIINWDSCGEMGGCRVVCPYDNIFWTYPAGGFGVSYKYG